MRGICSTTGYLNKVLEGSFRQQMGADIKAKQFSLAQANRPLPAAPHESGLVETKAVASQISSHSAVSTAR